MKKFLFFLFLVLAVTTFGAYDYGVRWNHTGSGAEDWIVNLAKENNSIREYGLFNISDSLNFFTRWVAGENYWTLGAGDNAVTISEDLGIWVKKSNGTYSSLSYLDYINHNAPGFVSADTNTVRVYGDKHWNGALAGVITFRPAESGATGQPLPGVAMTLLIGSCVMGAGYARRKIFRS